MADPQAQSPQGDKQTTVPLSDLLAVKEGLKKADRERHRLEEELANTKAELELLQANLGDDEVSAVKQQLIKKAKELDRRAVEISGKESALTETEKSLRAKELGLKHNVKPEELLASDDMEREALRISNERLSKELEEAKKAKSIYETGAPSLAGAQPKDMPPDKFDAYVRELRTKALARK